MKLDLVPEEEGATEDSKHASNDSLTLSANRPVKEETLFTLRAFTDPPPQAPPTARRKSIVLDSAPMPEMNMKPNPPRSRRGSLSKSTDGNLAVYLLLFKGNRFHPKVIAQRGRQDVDP